MDSFFNNNSINEIKQDPDLQVTEGFDRVYLPQQKLEFEYKDKFSSSTSITETGDKYFAEIEKVLPPNDKKQTLAVYYVKIKTFQGLQRLLDKAMHLGGVK